MPKAKKSKRSKKTTIVRLVPESEKLGTEPRPDPKNKKSYSCIKTGKRNAKGVGIEKTEKIEKKCYNPAKKKHEKFVEDGAAK